MRKGQDDLLEAKWREAGYHIISMKNDFKTIYGDGVVKTDFSFPVDTRSLTDGNVNVF